ncbi:MAG: thiamine phosphate synthase, partial [Epulopiscium sp.]|nr:thiamine phosphate synthase [Candidatus Epulonipiscium sp.]
MRADKKDMLLYAVTDRAWLGKRQLWEQVEDAIRGGATFIQLREKELDNQRFLEEAIQIKKITDQYHIPFVINDDVDIAIACGADGVHVGQKDMEARSVREKLGNDKIIGVSVQTVEQAIAA